MPDDLYWRITHAEFETLMGKVREIREAETKAANLRAGMIAAMVFNRHRQKGERAVKATDFFPEPRKEVPPETTWALLKERLRDHNARLRQRKERRRVD